MANVNANVNVIVNTQQAVTQLRLLTAEINNFNKQSFAANSAAAQQQKALNQALVDGVRTSGKFSTSVVPITSSVDKFSESLERNRLSLGQYTRYASSQLPGMRKVLTREFDMINSLAEERVKKLNTQFVRIGQSANGMQQALAMTPNSLDQFSSRSAIALQKQQIFNKLLRDGSTQLLNYGKNTQWAGRQLMVGFTIPLALLGSQAAKVFKELETEAINFKKVYGDMFTTDKEVEQNLSAIKELAKEMTKYGQSAQQTMQLANTAAQSGARGEELIAATTQATRLAILGQMEQAQAIETTISLQTAFSLSNEKLAESINFLNSVENQTILSLQDVSEAIPRVASVISGFGGDVQDLSVLLVAMKEGGVSAAEGANALKNSMARIVSPTRNALDVTAKYGIGLQDIVSRNKGQIVPLFIELSKALEAIGGQPRQEVLSAVFGKFQYARIGTLLSNIAKEGSQASKAIELTGTATRDLASTAERELSTVENSISTKFTAALEKAKISLAPLGGEFLKALTPVLEVIAKILGKFDELPGGIKTAIVAATAIIGGIAPVLLMVVGLVANGIANIAKFIMFLRKQVAVLRGNGEQFKQYSMAELDAAAATASLEGKTSSLTKTMLLQKPAIESLITLYARLAASAKLAAVSMPTTMGMPGAPAGRGGGFAAVAPRLPVVRRNSGGPIFSRNGTTVPGVGNTDTVPAMLTPGEFVINKKSTQKNFSLIKAINDGKINNNSSSPLPSVDNDGIQYARMGGMIKFLPARMMWQKEKTNQALAALSQGRSTGKYGRVTGNSIADDLVSATDMGVHPMGMMYDIALRSGYNKLKATEMFQNMTGKLINSFGSIGGRPVSPKKYNDIVSKIQKEFMVNLKRTDKNGNRKNLYQELEQLGFGRGGYKGRAVPSQKITKTEDATKIPEHLVGQSGGYSKFGKKYFDSSMGLYGEGSEKFTFENFKVLLRQFQRGHNEGGVIQGLNLGGMVSSPTKKMSIGGLVAASNAARGARGRIPGNIVDWFSRMTTSINQSSRDDLLQNIPENIKRGLSTSRRKFDITRGSIDPIDGRDLKQVSSWSTGQGVGRFMESSRLFETMDNSKFQISYRSKGMKKDIDWLKTLGPDGPNPGFAHSPFNKTDGALNTKLTQDDIKEAGGSIWKANKKKLEERIQRDQEFISGHQKIIDDLQESYIPTIYKTSVKKGEKYFDVSERIVPKDNQRINNPAASTEVLKEKEVALLSAKLSGKPKTKIVEKPEAQIRYKKAKEEIKKLRMAIFRKEISFDDAKPMLDRLYDESENMASFVNWGRGREVSYPGFVSKFGTQYLNRGGTVLSRARQLKMVQQANSPAEYKDVPLSSMFNYRFNDVKADTPSVFLKEMFGRWDTVPTRISPKENTTMLLKGKKPKYPEVSQEEYLADMIMSSDKFSNTVDAFKPISVGPMYNNKSDVRVFDGHTRIHSQVVKGLIEKNIGKDTSSMSKKELVEAIRSVRKQSLEGKVSDADVLKATYGKRVLTEQPYSKGVERLFERPGKQQALPSMYNRSGRVLLPGVHDTEINSIVNAAKKANFYGVKKDPDSLMQSMGFVSLDGGKKYRYDPSIDLYGRNSYMKNIGKRILDGLIDSRSILPLRRNRGGSIPYMSTGSTVPGSGNTDTVPAMLTPGEFVINKQSTQKNLSLLHAINDGKVSGFNNGGMIPGVQHLMGGGRAVALQRMMAKPDFLSPRPSSQPANPQATEFARKRHQSEGYKDTLSSRDDDNWVYHGGNFEKGMLPLPPKSVGMTQNLFGIGQPYSTRNPQLGASYMGKQTDTIMDQERFLYKFPLSRKDQKEKFLDVDRKFDTSDSKLAEIMSKFEENLQKSFNSKVKMKNIIPKFRKDNPPTIGRARNDMVANATDQFSGNKVTKARKEYERLEKEFEKKHTSDNESFIDTPQGQADLLALEAAKVRIHSSALDERYLAEVAWLEAVTASGLSGIQHKGGMRVGMGKNQPHDVMIWYKRPENIQYANSGGMINDVSKYANGGMIPGVQHLMGGGRAVALQRMKTMKASSQTQQRATNTTPKSKTLINMTDDDYNASFGSILRQSEIEDQASKTAFPSFNIRKNDQDYIFKGYGQEVPSSAIGKNKVLGITPQELLQEALIHRPGDKRLVEMLNNFNNKKYGKNENRLLDDIAASISIDKKGKMANQEDASGYAQVLSSLMGDQQATRLVSLKRKSLYSELNEIKRIKQKKARDNPQDTDATWDDKVFIHSTARGVNIDKKGNALIYSAGDATRGTPDSVPRSTVHTTINAPVESHMAGSWGDSNQLIVGNAKKVLSSNNPPSIVNVTDTAFPLNPGQPLRIPNASVVTPVTDAEKYKRLLMERKLINDDGNIPPFIINDDKTNDVLYFIKKEGTYTDDDRAAILKDTDFPAKPKDIVGRETEILKNEALTRAMRQQKVGGRPQKLAQWGTNNPEFDKGVNRLAAQKGLSGGIHQGSPSERIEMSALTNTSYTEKDRFNRFHDADIYSIRHVIASGHSKTKQSTISTRSRIDDDYGVTLNKGGFISPTLKMNNGNIVPGMGSKDTVPAMLTPGEFVINKKSTQKNLSLLHAINDGGVQKYAEGNEVTQAGKRKPRKPRGKGQNRSLKEMYSNLKKNNPKAARIMKMQIAEAEYAARAGARVGGQLQVDRAHDVMGKGPKGFSANPYGTSGGSPTSWRPQSAPENQWAKDMAGNSERSLKEQKALRTAMIDSGQSSKSVEKIMKKIEKGTRLQYGETQNVAKGLKTLNDNQEKYTQGMNKKEKTQFTERSRQFSAAAAARKEFRTGSTPAAISARAGGAFSAWEERTSKVSGTKAPIPTATDNAERKVLSKKEKKEQKKLIRQSAQRMDLVEKNRIKAEALKQSALSKEAARLKKESERERINKVNKEKTAQGKRNVAPALTSKQALEEARRGMGITKAQDAQEKIAQSKKPGRFAKMNAAAGKFGMGAGMGLSMASMMPMMGADKEGNFMGINATAAMGGLMGGGMLLSMAPMMGPLAAPILGVAAAATAVGVGLMIYRKNLDDASKRTAELGANMGGTANALNTISKLFGELTPAQRQTQLQMGFSAPEQEEAFGEFQNYLGSEGGQKFIKDLEGLSSAERFTKLSDYVKAGVASGLMDDQSARNFVQVIASSLKDPVLGTAVLSSIKGQKVGVAGLQGLAEERELKISESGEMKVAREGISQGELSIQDAGFAIGSSIQAIQDYANVIALAREQYASGEIAFDDYIAAVREAKDVQAEYSQVLRDSVKYSSDQQASRLALDTQLLATGVSQEQLDALTASTDIGVSSANVKDPSLAAFGPAAPLRLLAQLAFGNTSAFEEEYIQKESRERFEKPFSDLTKNQQSELKDEAGKAQDAASTMYAEGLPEDIRAAVAGGMDVGLAASLGKQIMNDPLSQMAKIYNERKEDDPLQALQFSAFAGTAEAQGVPGLEGEDLDQYVDIGIRFAEYGGSIEAYQAFFNNLPESLRVGIKTEFEGLSPEEVDKYILTQQQAMATGMSANQAAKFQKTDAYKEALKGSKDSYRYVEGKAPIKVEGDETALLRANEALTTLGMTFKEEQIDVALKIALEEDPPNIVEKIERMADTVRFLEESIPKEIQIAMGIDTGDAQQMEDLEYKKNQLAALSSIIQVMPEEKQEIAARIAVSVVNGKNEPLSGDELIEETNKVVKAIKNLESKNLDVEKKATLTVIESFENQDGERYTPEQANEFYSSWLKKFGQKKLSSLNTIDIQTVVNLESQVDGAESLIKSLDVALSVERDPEKIAILKKRREDAVAALSGYGDAIKSVFNDAGGSAAPSGGGGGAESPLKSFIKNIVDQAKMWSDASSTISKINNAKNLFVDMVIKGQSIFDKLKGTEGMTPEGLEQVLGMGPEGAKEFIKKYVKETNVTKKGKKVKNYTITKEGKNILNAQTLSGIGQTAASAYLEREAARDRKQAARGLNERGVSQEVMENISGDTNKSREFNALQKQIESSKGQNRKDAIKELNNYLKLQQNIVDEVKKEDRARDPIKHDIDEKIDKQKKAMDVANAYFDNEYAKIDEALQMEFESKNGMSAAQLEIDIKLREDAIDDIVKEIEVINDAIRSIETRRSDSSKYSEWGLEQLQKEISANQTLIAQYERQNEMDQRRIQTLQRQDELRNRESEAISYELDAMSQVEEKIRESYDKRLEALDKIAKVNDHLINQQKQQLGLSQAISEGDIYAATAAAQEIRGSSAQFASEQARSGLQENMENSVEGLLTSGGLTREQAEERIRQIKEQSYQTSLLIREIEDAIYNTNLNNILPLKDKEYNLNLGLKNVQDQIALKQEQIRVIEETRIEPLQKINASHTEALNDLALQTEVAQAAVKYEGLRKDQWDRMNNLVVAGLNWQRTFANDTIDARDNARSLANAWRDVSKQVDAARRAMTDKITILDNTAAEELNRKSADATYVNDDFDYEALLAAINADHSERIEGILSGAPALTLLNSGGNVLGSGSRDSVPAKLTPGEFVIRKSMVDKYGMPMFSKINQGSFSMPKYQTSTSSAGNVKVKSENNTNIVSPMYNNYSVSVNVSGSSSTADEVANKVMFKMKQLQNQNIRGNRG